MRRGRGLLAVGLALAAFAVATPSASAISNNVTSGKISCNVLARTPVFTKSATGAIIVTGSFRITCKSSVAVATTINVSVAPSIVELDTDRFGKFTVIDTKAQLAETVSVVTYRVGSELYKDVLTKSYTCVNSDTTSLTDKEELSTRVRISIVGGTWSTYDLSAYLSAPC